MENIIVVTVKSWNIKNFYKLKENKDYNWILIDDNEELTYESVKMLKPAYIFFPHWSWIIPKDIYENFKCIVFHMTDVPFGRGGSPLQNLISRGIYKTKISALEVSKDLDAGDVYMKKDFDLSKGDAGKLFRQASDMIFSMINDIIEQNPVPKKQVGKIVVFKRRTANESKIPDNVSIDDIYDWIRMLDAEQYPKAFIEYGKMKLEFTDAELLNGCIEAKVRMLVNKK